MTIYWDTIRKMYLYPLALYLYVRIMGYLGICYEELMIFLIIPSMLIPVMIVMCYLEYREYRMGKWKGKIGSKCFFIFMTVWEAVTLYELVSILWRDEWDLGNLFVGISTGLCAGIFISKEAIKFREKKLQETECREKE